jgi:hypothetical protein
MVKKRDHAPEIAYLTPERSHNLSSMVGVVERVVAPRPPAYN